MDMIKTATYVQEAANNGGFKVKNFNWNDNSGCIVDLEKNYIFLQVKFDKKNRLISDYLTKMMEAYNRSLGITLNKY